MKDNSYILNWSFKPDTFVLGAKDLLSKKEQKVIDSNTQQLRDITVLCGKREEEVPDKNMCNRIFRLFEANYKDEHVGDLFSLREIRHLIYAMHRAKEVEMMQKLLKLVDQRWRDRFFNGLLFYILSNFESAPEKVMVEVLSLMQKKLKQYEGKRDKFNTLKRNIVYFQINGPELLGLKMKKQDGEKSDYCSLKHASQTIFGMNRLRLDFEFFSRAIVTYFEKEKSINVGLIQEIMKLHNCDDTSKRLVPALVLNEAASRSEIYRDRVRLLAMRLIGDPASPSKWIFAKGTREEKQNLDKTREIINKWITRKIITIFFEKCVEDPKRKAFWIDHADLVEDFKLYCTEKTYAALKQDNRIVDIVDSKTDKVMEASSPLDPALGMLIGNYNIIEFASNRALQIYKSNEMKKINFLNELNINTLHNTIQSFCVNYEEGKLPHNSGWEKTLVKWFENHGIL